MQFNNAMLAVSRTYVTVVHTGFSINSFVNCSNLTRNNDCEKGLYLRLTVYIRNTMYDALWQSQF